MYGKVVAQYQNGNYQVALMENGTKIRFAEEPEGSGFHPEYPETIDMCITKKCSEGCPFCYEGCSPNGEQFKSEFLSYSIWDDIPPYTELAINGNDVNDISMLSTFLEMMQRKQVIVNMTVSMQQLLYNRHVIFEYLGKKLINSIGISISKYNELNLHRQSGVGIQPIRWKYSSTVSLRNLFDPLRYSNYVFHVVLGLVSIEELLQFCKYHGEFAGSKPKILLLGYKTAGRGIAYKHMFTPEINRRIEGIKMSIKELNEACDVIAFDNLACEQLDMKSQLSKEEWDMLYMGNDGCYSMYIDAVNCTFSKNSVTPLSERQELKNTMTLKDCFQAVRANCTKTGKPQVLSSGITDYSVLSEDNDSGHVEY